jgi:undecaprenyl-diphosphatase
MNTIDQSVQIFFQSIQSPGLTYGFYAFTWFFNTLPAVILITVATLFLFKWSGKRNTSEFLMAISVSFVLVWLVKFFVNHPRPELGIITAYGPSFPSAHAAVATTFFLFFLRFMRHDKNVFRKTTHQAFCVLAPFMVGLSRIYLGVHWLSDVVAGIVVGVMALVISRYIWKQTHNRTSLKV